MRRYLLFLFIKLWSSQQVFSYSNPCVPGEYEIFPGWLGLRNERCPTADARVQICDFYLDPKWYVFEEDGVMLNHCPASGDCGSLYPAWMNGSYPTIDDDEVPMNVCVKQGTDCCKKFVPMTVKNCSSFLVYHLQPLPECTSTYCVETSLNCEAPTTTTKSTTTSTTTTASTADLTQGLTEKQIVPDNDDWKTALIIFFSVVIGLLCLAGGGVGVYYLVHRSIINQRRIGEENPPPPYTDIVKKMAK